MKRQLSKLQIHKDNHSIYGDTDAEAVANLAEHMGRVGQITPIVITKSGTVISGARRVSAAKQLGWKSIEAVVKDIPKKSELFYVIQANKQRHKTSAQLCNEIDALWTIYENEGAYSTHPTGTKTRDKVAADLGVSNKSIQQLRFIKTTRPDLLPYIGTSLTLAACYGQVRLYENQKQVLDLKKTAADRVELNAVDFQLYTKSSADMSELADNSIDHIVTSPPYLNQRQFTALTGNGTTIELGQEETIDEYIDNLLKVLEECRRVMKKSSSLMLNLGDTYHKHSKMQVPERVSIAVQDRLGLLLRNTLIWWKSGSMTPESTKRRRHTDYEYVYHFVLDAEQYYYDADAIRIPYVTDQPTDRKPPRHFNHEISKGVNARWVYTDAGNGGNGNGKLAQGVNASWVNRNVGGKLTEPVTISNIGSSVRHPIGKIPGCILDVSRHTTPLKMAGEAEHTASFPDRLVRELLKPIAQAGDIILDPFAGSSTTGAVALEYGCFYVGYDTNKVFNRIGAKRLKQIREELSHQPQSS